jgi:hypothetical protein
MLFIHGIKKASSNPGLWKRFGNWFRAPVYLARLHAKDESKLLDSKYSVYLFQNKSI